MKTKSLVLGFMMILPSLSFAAVDLLNGGYVYRLQISAPTKEGTRLPLTIQYRSRSIWSTNIGFGWCAQWTTQLELLGEKRFRLRDCDGDLIFTDQNSPTGNSERLLSNQGDELRLHLGSIWIFRQDGRRLRFSRQGLLLERWKGQQTERFIYDGFNRLRQWQHPDYSILFSYQGVQREARALYLPQAPYVRLKQHLGNLEMIEMNGPAMHFEYDDLNNLTVIREGRLELERIRYLREQDLVKSIFTSQLKLELDYQKNSQGDWAVQQLRRQVGNQRLIYSYQPSGLLHQIQRFIASESQLLSEQTLFKYNQQARLIAIITPQGKKINLSYNAQGQLQNIPQLDLLTTAALHKALEQLAPLNEGFVL